MTMQPPAGATLTGPLRNQRGQGLVEMGLVVTVFVLLSMGIIEFGRAFMVANMVTHAARDGARAASMIGLTQRDQDGCFNVDPAATIGPQVIAEIGHGLDAETAGTFTVQVFQGLASDSPESGCSGNNCATPLNAGDIPVVRLCLTGSVPYMFNLVGSTGFPVSRIVTFRDEGRIAP
jgi:Flp pilus assembly protein TadG